MTSSRRRDATAAWPRRLGSATSARSERCCGTGGRTAGAARWTWRSTSACRPGTSASSRPASRSRPPSSCWRSPSTSTCRCASATRCCSPPATPRGTRRRRSTTTAMATVRGALAGLIRAHDPYPAVVVDRAWDIVMSNTGAQALPRRRRRHLLAAARCNSYRITLHPDGHGAAHRQLRRVGAPPARHARPPGRGDPRPPAARRCSTRCSAYPNVAALGTSWRTRERDADGRRAAAAARPATSYAVVVLDEHVDRHARRHHARRAPRRAVPPRRRGDGGAGRRTHGLSNVARRWSIDPPAATDEEAAAIAAAVEALWPRPAVAAAGADRRPSVWRFSGRWWSQPIPLRRARPWV